jgi:RNA polymerase sigma-70 factor (ECF subfamily)
MVWRIILSQPDSELAALAARGDRTAFSLLCERHKARLWGIAAGVAKGPDAEDLAQEAIVRAWCAIETCRNPERFEAWLCRIAVNAAYDYHRSAWKRRVVFLAAAPSMDESEFVEDTIHTAARRETARKLRRAVASLPPKQCIAIWMHYFEQFSLAEIAMLEGAAESTIRSRIQVGMRRLHSILKDLVNDGDILAEKLAVVKGMQI